MTRLHAARVAARIRRELQADVDMVHDHYGVFKVVMDGETIIDGGAAAFLGILPSGAEVLAAIKGRLEA